MKDKNGNKIKLGDTVQYGKQRGTLDIIRKVYMFNFNGRYTMPFRVDFSKMERIEK